MYTLCKQFTWYVWPLASCKPVEWLYLIDKFEKTMGSLQSIMGIGPSRDYECHTERLLDVCLSAIFHRLDWRDRVRVEKVCRRWRRVVKESGWAEFRTFDNIGALSAYQMETAGATDTERTLQPLLPRHGSTLREVSIYVGGGTEQVQAVLALCPNVVHLRLQLPEYESFRADCIPIDIRARLITLQLDVDTRVSYPSLRIPHCLPIISLKYRRQEVSPSSIAFWPMPSGSSRCTSTRLEIAGT